MELTIVDLSEIPGVQVGDEVVLLGKQGPEGITRRRDGGMDRKHPLWVLCSIEKRVPQVYQRSEG